MWKKRCIGVTFEEEFHIFHLRPCTVDSICESGSLRFSGWHYRLHEKFQIGFWKAISLRDIFSEKAETVYVENRIEIQEWSLPVLYLNHSSQENGQK